MVRKAAWWTGSATSCVFARWYNCEWNRSFISKAIFANSQSLVSSIGVYVRSLPMLVLMARGRKAPERGWMKK